jgi:hypothetical protein
MKFSAMIFMVLFLFTQIAVAQTEEEIRLEAFPVEQVTDVLTEFDLLWQKMIHAKYNGDEKLHKETLEKLSNDFPGQVTSRGLSPTAPRPSIENFYSVNLRTNDIALYTNNIYTGGINTHTGENNRTIRIRSDMEGNQYVGFINAARDTLYVFKSADGITWGMLQSFYVAGGAAFQGFDFVVTDSASVNKIGFAVSVNSSAAIMDATVYFMLINSDGSNFRVETIEVPAAGRGLISPSIYSDGYFYDPEFTYWYVAYSNYSASTPGSNAARAALTANWGGTWVATNARSTFNDYELQILHNKYKLAQTDSIYVLLTNNLTLSNPNLRLRRVELANFTGTWGQYNPATSSLPENQGVMALNRETDEMVVAFRIITSGNENVAYVHGVPGTTPFTVAPTYVGAGPHQERNPSVAFEDGGNRFKFSYTASGASYDTVIAKSSMDLSQGFVDTTVVVNETVNSSPSIVPDIMGFTTAAIFGTGVIYAGQNNSGLYYHLTVDGIVPVELTSFSALLFNNVVQLNWTTATETNNSGFYLERKTAEDFETVAFIQGKGTTTEKQFYTFSDDISSLNSEKFYYRLKQIDYDGSFAYSNIIEVDNNMPVEYNLAQNYPNPFNPSTRINYQIPADGFVSLKVFDILGNKVATLINEHQAAGSYEFNFDGSSLSTGVYFYQLNVNEFTSVKKMLLTK